MFQFNKMQKRFRALTLKAMVVVIPDSLHARYNKEKDKDKDKDAFIGLKEFVSHMMMTQTKDKLFHPLK